MTIETITLSRELVECDACPASGGCVGKCMKAPTDPVPPAGGEVEVLGYSVKGNRYAIRLTKAELLDLYEGYTGDALVELVDRAHVTRLQAEVERLKEEWDLTALTVDTVQRKADQLQESLQLEQEATAKWQETAIAMGAQQQALQSELTKAQELIGDLRADTQSGYLKAVQALHNWANQTAPRGYSNIVMTGTSCNQSAPADKGQDHE